MTGGLTATLQEVSTILKTTVDDLTLACLNKDSLRLCFDDWEEASSFLEGSSGTKLYHESSYITVRSPRFTLDVPLAERLKTEKYGTALRSRSSRATRLGHTATSAMLRSLVSAPYSHSKYICTAVCASGEG